MMMNIIWNPEIDRSLKESKKNGVIKVVFPQGKTKPVRKKNLKEYQET